MRPAEVNEESTTPTPGTKEHRMTSNARADHRILGSLRSADGAGVVRIEDRYDADIDDLWAALTDPGRLARWYGQVEGDLRPGGEFRLYLESDGWDGTGRVEACEPPSCRPVAGSRATWPSLALPPIFENAPHA